MLVINTLQKKANDMELSDSINLIRKTLLPESAALAAVNQLVELVAEMARATDGLRDRYVIDGHFCGHSEAKECLDAAIKADVFLNKLEE